MRTSRNPTFGSSATEFGRSYTCTTLLPPRKSDSRHQSGDFWMSKSYDRYLGLDRSITRRDFMNGLKDFSVGGKLELSLKNYIELVMANNTQIQLQFLTLEIPKNNIESVFGKWDPTATASFSTTRQTSVPTNPATAGSATLGSVSKSLTQPLALGYSQTLDTGMNYQVTFSECSRCRWGNTRAISRAIHRLACKLALPMRTRCSG